MKLKLRAFMTYGLIALATLCCSACAPQFIDVTPPPTKTVWVERDAKEIHEAIGETDKKEIVRSDVAKYNAIDPDDLVVWVAGVDVAHSKFQRQTERLVGTGNMELSSSKEGGGLTKTYVFNVVGEALAADGRLALQEFKAEPLDRFYVEFLNKDAMTEKNVKEKMAAWGYLLKELKSRGLNASNIVLGGGRYKQDVDAIVLVKIGK